MIFNAYQVRAWDEFTIRNEPISSLQLMERAAAACVRWLEENEFLPGSFSIFCGKGNNGGDGLAIARMLSGKGCKVSVHILEFGHLGTADFQANLARLHGMDVEIRFIQSEANLTPVPPADIIIDALLGSGLNRPIEGVTAALVKHLNTSGNRIISIDIPTGLFVDKSSAGNVVVTAMHTLSFQCYKTAFLVAENEQFTGQVHILDIGLHPGFLKENNPQYHWITPSTIRGIYRVRKKFAHKGNFGHALLLAGSYGKMGAAVLAARACLRAGVGLLTMQVPKCGIAILQTAVPEAMCVADREENFLSAHGDLSSFSSIGIGPGIGRAAPTHKLVESLIHSYGKPLVFDADALNIISETPSLLQDIPPLSILTPHPKEFSRLFGEVNNDFDRIDMARNKAAELKIIIVLKGRFTMVALPSGDSYFNATGNAGMATGGTGDVLTGIITSLLAQGYEPENAARLGVYWHGFAGDIAAGVYTQESLIASDIPDALGTALQKILSSVNQDR